MLSIRCRNVTARMSGFTLVEMLVVAPIVLLTIAVFVGILIQLTGETLSARASNSLTYEIHNALDTIERDINISGGFLAVNNVAITSPQGLDNATQEFRSNGDGHRLILNAFASQSTSDWSTRRIIPIRNLPHTCTSSQIMQNQVVTYNVIYFVKDNSLWRRVLLPSNYATIGCQVPIQQPSCSPGVTGGLCRAEDSKLIDKVDTLEFTVDYYTSPGSPSPEDSANTTSDNNARQAILSSTNTARITIRAAKSVAGATAEYKGSVLANRIGPLNEQATPVP